MYCDACDNCDCTCTDAPTVIIIVGYSGTCSECDTSDPELLKQMMRGAYKAHEEAEQFAKDAEEKHFREEPKYFCLPRNQPVGRSVRHRRPRQQASTFG